MDHLKNAVDMLPDDFPFSMALKNITKALASEPQGNFLIQICCLSASLWTMSGILDLRQLYNEK